MRKKSLRLRVIEGLEKRRGPGCQCCGYNPETVGPVTYLGMTDEERYMFFAIDHVHNGGSLDRKCLGLRGNKFFKWVIDHDYPETIQILCHACNQAKRLNGGVCPHNE